MVYPHGEVRDQRALDVANHLFWREFRRRQDVNLVYRAAVSRNDSR
jgi:hypothetical protein